MEENQENAFSTLGLKEGLLKTLQKEGFTTPTPIQKEVIPLVLKGKDIIGQAQTGTGKTAAFGLPALHLLSNTSNSQLLVLTPTRELAKQIHDELYRFGKAFSFRAMTICGGKAFRAQIDSLRNGTEIIVATPGRLLDLLESKDLQSFAPSIVVLDEADEMLDMGFLPEIEKIFKFLPKERQTLLFSATMRPSIQDLAHQILQKPVLVNVSRKDKINEDIEQAYYMIREEERDEALFRLLDTQKPVKSIIFCRTKKEVDRLTSLLLSQKYLARGLHGDMEQPQREEVIRHFTSEEIDVLVATDVAARGLSIRNVSHVFNYHLPFDSESYVHRIGRTGRAGNKGIALTFVTPREFPSFQRYQKIMGAFVKRKTIPTLEELKRLKQRELLQKIHQQPLQKESEEFLKMLEKEVENSQIIKKLLSFILEQQRFDGPETIGFDNSPISSTKTFSRPSFNKKGERSFKSYRRSSSPDRKSSFYSKKDR